MVRHQVFCRVRASAGTDNRAITKHRYWVGVECTNCQTFVLMDVWTLDDSREELVHVISADMVFPTLKIALRPEFRYLSSGTQSLLRESLEALEKGSAELAYFGMRSVLDEILERWETRRHTRSLKYEDMKDDGSGTDPTLSKRIKYYATTNEHHILLCNKQSALATLMRRLRLEGDNAFQFPLSKEITFNDCDSLLQTCGLISLLLS
jgi:hypothetical protein